MYKVFVNDRPLFIHKGDGSNFHNINKFHRISVGEMNPEKLYQITGQNKADQFVFFAGDDLETFWHNFNLLFYNIAAAGGIVQRSDLFFLGMYRLGKWDLPKGKAEAGETAQITAVREVEEECGISGLEVQKKLMDTFHVYPYKDGYALKRTHWYLMSWSHSGELVPQKEEGIEELRWFGPEEKDEFCASTYGSVAEVVQAVYG